MGGVVLLQRGNTPNNWSSTSDPTNSSDAADGIRVGDYWYNTTTTNVWVCVTNTVGAAVWRHIPRTWVGLQAYTLTGTTSESVMATVAIPAGALGVNGLLEIANFWTYTNSANSKTFRTRFGASGSGTGATQFQGVVATTTVAFQDIRWIKNQNSASVQRAFPGGAGNGITSSAGTIVAGTVDTTAATDVIFTGLLASSGETIILESFKVTLYRPDIT